MIPEGFLPEGKYARLAFFFIVLSLIILFIYMIVKAFTNTSYLETPKNIKRIQQEQSTALTNYFGGKVRSNLETVLKEIPEEQRLLINVNVLSLRLAGYLGPYKYGVFDEDNATRIALQTGARCLILEIDHLEGQMEPVLLYRDGWNMKYSLNQGSIERVAKNIAGRAFSQTGDGAPSNLANDPFFLVLHFRNTPSIKDPANYIRFMASVSRQLQPLKNLLLGQTPQGDFRRQANASELFFLPTTLFQNKILLFTNADTTMFRNLKQYGLENQFSPEDDLDFLVHARVGTDAKKEAVVLTSPQYWLTTPPDRLNEAISSTKQAWTLVMNDSTELPTEKLKEVFNTYGVHSFPFSLADSVQTMDKWLATGSPFASSAWNVKPAPLRFIPPAKIPIQKAMPQMNAVGGAIPSPSL